MPQLLVTGVKGLPADNIRNTIDLSRYHCSDAEWQLQSLLKRTKSQANNALQALGYYQSEMNVHISSTESCWAISIDVISAGDRVHLNQVEIQIIGALAQLPEFVKARQAFPLKAGIPLNQSDYEKTKSEIEIIAAQYGFLQGKFITHRLEINPKTNQAHAILRFESGPRLHFGEITIKQSAYNEALINQFTTIKQGEAYDSQALIKQQQLFDSSGYFSEVEVITDQAEIEDNSIPVSITLKPIKKHRYRFGIGASTDTGPRISFDYENRRINRAGHDFSFDSRLSDVRSELTFNYGIPQGAAGIDRFDVQLGYLSEDIESGRHESYKIAALHARLTENKWLRTAFLEYLTEDFRIEQARRSSHLLMPGVRFHKTISDHLMYPRKGWSLHTGFRLASEEILSSTNLLQLTFNPKFVWPLGKGRLLSRFNVGASLVDDFEKLPTSLRFFAGGDESVRGFGYKSLSPEGENGQALGGKNLLVGSIEYEHPVYESWGLAVFIDTGNAFDDFNGYSLETGAGLGVRWHSPIGPIRLDLAQDIKGDHSPRLHLSMGRYL